MDDQPAFEVRQPDGHTYLIYADGRTEGFGEGVRVNRIPQLTKRSYEAGQLHTTLSAQEACQIVGGNFMWLGRPARDLSREELLQVIAWHVQKIASLAAPELKPWPWHENESDRGVLVLSGALIFGTVALMLGVTYA